MKISGISSKKAKQQMESSIFYRFIQAKEHIVIVLLCHEIDFGEKKSTAKWPQNRPSILDQFELKTFSVQKKCVDPTWDTTFLYVKWKIHDVIIEKRFVNPFFLFVIAKSLKMEILRVFFWKVKGDYELLASLHSKILSNRHEILLGILLTQFLY